MHIIAPASCITYTEHNQELGSQASCLQLCANNHGSPRGIVSEHSGGVWVLQPAGNQSTKRSRGRSPLLLMKGNNCASS